MDLVELVKLLEKSGLDTATAETLASMAQSQSISEAQTLLTNVLGSTTPLEPYFAARKRAELKKLKIKEDSHGGVVQNGKLQTGVARNGITVVSEKSHKKNLSSSTASDTISTSDKVDLVRDLEAALKSLSIGQKSREKCDCLGSQHGLLEMAPNCLNCGRIVCNREGMGPCLFCNQLLLPTEQINQILTILETQKSEVISTMSRKALAAAGISATQTKKNTAQHINQSSEKAQANLERLLSYQANDSVRTRIIDQAGDTDLPSSGLNQWASPEEQAAQLRKQQQQLRRNEHERKARSGMGRKVLSIDVRGNKIFANVEDAAYESDEDAELIGKGDAEPVTTTQMEPELVHYYDPQAFSNQRQFSEKLSAKPTSPQDFGGMPAVVRRNPDESLAY